jgi:hypothetical protein
MIDDGVLIAKNAKGIRSIVVIHDQFVERSQIEVSLIKLCKKVLSPRCKQTSLQLGRKFDTREPSDFESDNGTVTKQACNRTCGELSGEMSNRRNETPGDESSIEDNDGLATVNCPQN